MSEESARLKTRKATSERRANMKIFVIKTKIQLDSLNKTQARNLSWIFIEAKRYYNFILNWEQNKKNRKLKDFDTKTSNVVYLNKDRVPVDYTTRLLCAQSKQSIKQRMLDSIKGLHTLKENGVQKPGKLKFKSNYNAINYKQPGNSWKLINDHTIRLQNLGKFRVNGLREYYYNKEIEYGNAQLIRKGKNYYIYVTAYLPIKEKEKVIDYSESTNKVDIIGIDMGCSDNFVLSTGEKINIRIEEPERLKRLQRKLAKQVKGSNNYNKTLTKIQNYHAIVSNKKQDEANKLVRWLFENHDVIVIQDEQLSNWKKNGHGKAVHHSILGRVKSLLKECGETSNRVAVLPKRYPTSKFCRRCGQYHDDLNVWDRVFECDCGVCEDRDIHAARNMVFLFEQLIGVGCPDLKRAELEPILAGVVKDDCTASKLLTQSHESAA